ncbi:MAG: GNAT family N-acetyltransferase [Mycolicibacterium sp.]|uniref:GNAT family N-acetyltransferase n=1 Tax=Mycolicibacterium sp. TaxID=2320850 RepID=UPI000FBF925F|nr:GNAT family N-acetyltransferase [Mycolicibacterium sp.]RUP27852.1 MAG: GNAT family N-acetyltransferase [Mycolicibacterium sp.]
MGPAATFMRLAMKQGNRVFVHPATRDELVEGKNPDRVRQRLAELAKFQMLDESPISAQLRNQIGPVIPDSNNDRDLRILAALNANAANFLVSDDAGLHRRARRADIGDRVLTLNDAVAMLEGLEPTVASPPPMVSPIQSYALDFDQNIFISLRQDYDDFDKWIAKIQGDSDNRDCFVVKDEDDNYAAIAILKTNEPDCEYDFIKPVTKISTFKVGPEFSGNRYGELLLNAVLQSHHDHRVGSAYVEVWGHHQPLIDFLATFGYVEAGKSAKGEVVLAKMFGPRDENLPPLEYHVRYGPPAVSRRANVFAIPIIDRWHDHLFPECIPDSGQLSLPGFAVSIRPWGNALRKAYLCNSSSQQIRPGDAILFYRSGFQTVSVVGVVEQTVRSWSPEEVLNLVGGRTVYGASDITQLASHSSGVLVVLFRRDRVIAPAWTLAELRGNDVLKAPPQTVTQVKETGAQWVHQQLAAT